jgi:hypothetical protein
VTDNDVQRSTLPIPDLAYTGTVTYDATDFTGTLRNR